MNTRLYYHETDGGAKYLTNRYILCPDGSREGVFEGASIIVRIDGNIREYAEVTVKSDAHDALVAAMNRAAFALAGASHYLPDDKAIEMNETRAAVDAALALARPMPA